MITILIVHGYEALFTILALYKAKNELNNHSIVDTNYKYQHHTINMKVQIHIPLIILFHLSYSNLTK